jgi:transcriptional regulator with XRE-family HTH domain
MPEIDIRRSVGKRVRELREAAGLSKSDVAALARLSRHWVGAIETGTKAPGLEALEKLAGAFRVSVRDLLDPAPAPVADAAHRVMAIMRTAEPNDLALFERIARAYFGRPPGRRLPRTREEATAALERVLRLLFGSRREIRSERK